MNEAHMMKRQAFALFTTLTLLSACAAKKASAPGDDNPPPTQGEVGEAIQPNVTPTTTFSALIRVEDRDGGHPAASVSYAGTTYSTDASGTIVIPGMTAADSLKGLAIIADGFMPRSVAPELRTAGASEGLRVVLERAGVTLEFDANDGAETEQGPMSLTFQAGSFLDANGNPYTGAVHLAALGTDPLVSFLQFDANGNGLRPDVDPARIPQGYNLGANTDGSARFFLPESIFQAELQDEAGGKLSLADGAPATYRFKLQSMTTHREGDVVPTFTFDTEAQRWKEEGTCTVVRESDDTLSCVGTTTHFSTWTLVSGENKANPYCGNLKFRVLGVKGTASVTVKSVNGRDSLLEKPTNFVGDQPGKISASGLCFLQNKPFAGVLAHVTVTDGADVKTYRVNLSPEALASSIQATKNNLELAPFGKYTVAELDAYAFDATCGGCAPTYVDIDLSSAVPRTLGLATTSRVAPARPVPRAHASAAPGSSMSMFRPDAHSRRVARAPRLTRWLANV
jgi:hypothetical protein